jgi:catalase
MEHELTETESEAARIIDAVNATFGPQHGNRALHAKGIVLVGSFEPSREAAAISKAPHFQKAMPVTVRFSDSSGIPNVADTDPMASPRGMAVRFHLPDGKMTDLVTHSFNGFPVSTAEEFREMFVALATSGPDAPHPSPAERFLGSHPRARAFFEAPKPPTVSWATARYFAVNSFRFTNARGDTVIGRYRLEPAGGEKLLPEADLARAGRDYLREEIRARVAKAPARFDLILQLAGPEDRVDDPSLVWPESRKLVKLGTLEVRELVPDNEAAESALVFHPAGLPPGIETADPMLEIRSKAYLESYHRRHSGR